jgi:hypothetical protein
MRGEVLARQAMEGKLATAAQTSALGEQLLRQGAVVRAEATKLALKEVQLCSSAVVYMQ